MTSRNVYSGSPWESSVAYCRAKRVGDHVFVSGTVSVDSDGRAVGVGSVYEQARHALKKIERALEDLGSGLRDVVRTRTFLVDMTSFDEFARAHREAFEGVDPAATCVQVARLVSAEFAVEIEADAIVGAGREPPLRA